MLKIILIGVSALLLSSCGNSERFHDGVTCFVWGDDCPATQDDVSRLEASIASLEAYLEQVRGELGADITSIYEGLNEVVKRTNQSVTEIIDLGVPGGEVIFKMADGSFVAWYKNVGLYVLLPGVTYQTTDSEKVNFKIVNGTVVEL